MKTFKNLFLVALAFFTATVFAQDYKVNTETSTLKWNGKKVTGEHYGFINLKSGEFTVKDKKITSGEFVIDMTSLTVEDLEGEWRDKLTGHLNSDDFFGTADHPTAKLVITKSGTFKNGVAQVTGNLSIKGKTHPVTFNVKNEGGVYTSTITVDRTLYDVRYGSDKFFDNLGDKTIYDEFTLEVTLKTK